MSRCVHPSTDLSGFLGIQADATVYMPAAKALGERCVARIREALGFDTAIEAPAACRSQLEGSGMKAGRRVRLRGLQKAAELNGQVGTVTKLLTGGRCQVLVFDARTGPKQFSLKPSNLKPCSGLLDDGGEEDAVTDAVAGVGTGNAADGDTVTPTAGTPAGMYTPDTDDPGVSAGGPASPGWVAAGTAVIIVGLTKAPQMNGRRGVIKAALSSGRVKVRLDVSDATVAKTFSVAQTNLVPCPPGMQMSVEVIDSFAGRY